MISDIKIGLEEDNRNYYINAGNTFTKISKNDYSLKISYYICNDKR